MEKLLLQQFQVQVELQCEFLLAAAHDVNTGLAAKDVRHTFYALQNVLNAGANISKALWGSGGKLADKRKPLRDSIGIEDCSPLRDVAMRNNFEHFDERLDRWWAESENHTWADLNIGNRASFEVNAEIDSFRIFDPRTTDITFWGERFNLQTLVIEVEKILPKLQEELNTPR